MQERTDRVDEVHGADRVPLRGSPRRRPRLSDAETEERMLAAGARLVAAQGLSLSLEHLRMEELIAEAEVSRTSSYRRWPTKDLFAADLLLRLARATDLPTAVPPGLVEALAAVPADLLDGLGTAQGRRDAVVEVLRVVVGTDFHAMLGSTAWQSYVALRAAHLGLPDGQVREQVAEALRGTERRFTERRAVAFRALADLVGYRLVHEDLQGWQRLSLTLGAVATGLLVRGWSDPAAVSTTTLTAVYGSGRTASGDAATLASVGVLLGAIEPDPDLVWDEARVAALRARLEDADGTTRALLAAID